VQNLKEKLEMQVRVVKLVQKRVLIFERDLLVLVLVQPELALVRLELGQDLKLVLALVRLELGQDLKLVLVVKLVLVLVRLVLERNKCHYIFLLERSIDCQDFCLQLDQKHKSKDIENLLKKVDI